MTPSTVHLNGHRAAAPAPDQPHVPRRSRIWPGMIFVLLGMNMTIVAITVYFATTDKSVATEPDYYAKALAYDRTIAIREASRVLGWRAEPVLRPAADGRSMELAVTMSDHAGAPVSGAVVSAEAFASARSGERQFLKLAPLADAAPGVYVSPIRMSRAGVWHVRLNASRGGDTFAHESDVLVPESGR